MRFFLLFLFCYGLACAQDAYFPLGKTAYTTSSFAESRGTRYHAGIDFSTQMEEGWPVLAPADGVVEALATSPFGYGKHLRFRTSDGNLWLFAHLAGFHARLDSLEEAARLRSRTHRAALEPNMAFRAGDTLAFSGSTGIGNPHLHVEWRAPDGRFYRNPCASGMNCADTVRPWLLGAVVQSGDAYAFTTQSALQSGCLEVPRHTGMNPQLALAFKIVDYSREPYTNPMSVYRLTLRQKNRIVFEKRHDSLALTAMLPVRDELLWSEEADTAGDWHAVQAKISLRDTLRLELEDFAGNRSLQALRLAENCSGEAFVHPVRYQDSLLFSFLARPWISLSRCGQGHWEAWNRSATGRETLLSKEICSLYNNTPAGMLAFHALRIPGKGKISELRWVEGTDTLRRIQLENTPEVQQKWKKPGPTAWPRSTAWQYRTADSLQPARWEFHPKGMQILDAWEVCIDTSRAPHPLYWQGETSRQWFIFSKQELRQGKRCVTLNEHRDIASLLDTLAPELGVPYHDSLLAFGRYTPALRIPVLDNLSGLDFNCLSAADPQGNWIPLDYDSEPRELVFARRWLPSPGQKLRVNLCDEAGNIASREITIPAPATPGQTPEHPENKAP